MITSFLDNWHYVKRIGLTQYRTAWQKKWQDWCLGFSYFCVLVLTITGQFVDCWLVAKQQLATQMKQHLRKKVDSSGGCDEYGSFDEDVTSKADSE